MDLITASGVHVAPREAHSPDLPAYVEVCHRAEGEESQPISSVRVLAVETLGLKLYMQPLVLMMHGSEKQT